MTLFYCMHYCVPLFPFRCFDVFVRCRKGQETGSVAVMGVAVVVVGVYQPAVAAHTLETRLQCTGRQLWL